MSTPPNLPLQRGGNTYRVVSSPLISKGKTELLLCNNEKSLERITRLDRDRNRIDDQFGRTTRGDIVTFQNDRLTIMPKD